MVRRVAQHIKHHHRIGHGREDRAEPILAIEPRGHERDRRIDGALAQALGKQRLDRAHDVIDDAEEDEPEPFLVRRLGQAAQALRLLQKQFLDRDPARVAGARHQGAQHQQRREHGARPVGNLVDMKRKPSRQQRDLHRHRWHRVPRYDPVERQQGAGEHVAAIGAAMLPDRRAGAGHMRRVRRIADHLQREIGLHAAADIEIAVVKQRPAAMPALGAAQIDGDFLFQHRVRQDAEIMLEQHVFGRDRSIGFEFEHPVPVRLLAREQRVGGGFDRFVESC